MKNTILGLSLAFVSLPALAVKLSDYKPFVFEPLFTNPVCATYNYDRPMITENGKTVTSKPKNVYCKGSDEAASVARSVAPQYRLKEWISSPDTKELYLAYLSFSSKNIAKSLCDAVARGVKITMVLDTGEERLPNKDAEALKSCGRAGLVEVNYRGTEGGLGYAHNKIMVVNPGQKVVKIVFSSGNMSSGTSTNHENWNFVTTSGDSFFAGAHKCVVEAMISGGHSTTTFKNDLNGCRAKIKAQPETDIKTYFSPVDGREALAQVQSAGTAAKDISAMSHRFSGEMARTFQSLLGKGKPIRFILDDDIYWSKKLGVDTGRNMVGEAAKIYNDLIARGMNTRFLQTNQTIFQLQHNKFIVYNFGAKGAVFNGAGNFTSAAFNKNFENFYYIEIPEVVEAYKKQYDMYFNQMASAPGDMPRDNVLP